MYKRFALTIFIRFVVANARPTLACGYEQYRVKGEGTCRTCPICKEGYGLNECRADIIYDPGNQPTCLTCIDGSTFSSHEGSGPCDLCSSIEKDQREIRKCTRFHDRLTECKHGLFENKGHHQCSQQCCYCDGKRTQEIGKCKRDDVPERRFCAPTRWDGKCELKIKTTTKAFAKSSSTFVPTTNEPTSSRNTPIPSTSSSSYVSTPFRPTLPRPTVAVPTVPSVKTEPSPFPEPVPANNKEGTSIAVIVLVTILVCAAIVVLGLIAYRGWLDSCLKRNGNSKMYEVNDPSNYSYGRVPGSSGTPSENSSVRNSRVVEETGHFVGSQDLLMIAMQNNATRTPEHLENDYAVCGRIKLSSLEYNQRKTLGEMLDTNVWLDIGIYLANANEPLKIKIKRCHECYYGGGNASIHLFERLEQEKPDLTVAQFIETSRELGRDDVIRYVSEKTMNISLFSDILYEQKQYIAGLIEKRLDVGHYWPSYAEKLLGLSSNEIATIRLQKRIPQKYSPTMEMINVLCAHKPEIKVEEFQEAAAELGCNDVKEFLEEIIRKRLNEGDI